MYILLSFLYRNKIYIKIKYIYIFVQIEHILYNQQCPNRLEKLENISFNNVLKNRYF